MKTEDLKPAAFDINSIDSLDESQMEVIHKGRPTGWFWTIAGPGHERTIAQSNRILNESMVASRAMEQARANGKKWKPVSETVEELREKNVKFICERVLGWSEVNLDGKPYPFSVENLAKLVRDPRKVELVIQVLDFINDEKSFTRTSATAS